MSTISHLSVAADAASEVAVSGAPRPVLLPPVSAEARHEKPALLRLAPAPTPRPSPEPEIPEELETVARKVARGALEVLGGTRPLQQMSRLLDARSYERLQLRSNLVRSVEQSNLGSSSPRSRADGTMLHRNVLIRTVRICPITSTIFEVSVVAAEQKRVRALALRIERWRGQWRVSELQIG